MGLVCSGWLLPLPLSSPVLGQLLLERLKDDEPHVFRQLMQDGWVDVVCNEQRVGETKRLCFGSLHLDWQLLFLFLLLSD